MPSPPPPPLPLLLLLPALLLALPRAAAQACPPGEWRNSTGSCHPCTTCPPITAFAKTPCGTSSDAVCALCPSGSQSASANALTCACIGSPANGFWTTPTNVGAVLTSCCQANSVWDGILVHGCKCNQGYFEADGASSFTCTPCPPGYYSLTSSPGAAAVTQCTLCPANTYAWPFPPPASPAYSCQGCGNCGAGSYASVLCNQTQNRQCSPCTPGTFTSGGNNFGACPPCPSGTFQPGSGGQSCQGTQCPSGTFGPSVSRVSQWRKHVAWRH